MDDRRRRSCRITRAIALGVATLLLGACGDDGEEASQPAPTSTIATPTTVAPGARTDLVSAQGQAVGQVTFAEEGGKLVVEASVRGLPAGFHGFHIHAVGKCEADFTSAGGHLAVGDQAHPAHAGDQPVLMVLADGSGSLRFVTDRYKLSDLLTPEGRAVIVHALADNYGNVPSRYVPEVDAATKNTGDAGGRIACGPVRRS
ncbi:MAG: superoxide dismutase family protein [Actinobacteria bacterium]|nr:superoxide dismutase family protein [Actinomycetota bacterium]